MPIKDYLTQQPPLIRQRKNTSANNLASRSSSDESLSMATLQKIQTLLTAALATPAIPQAITIPNNHLEQSNTPLIQAQSAQADIEAPSAIKNFQMTIPVKKTYLKFFSIWHLETQLVQDTDEAKQNLDLALSSMINGLDDTISDCDTIPKTMNKIALGIATFITSVQLAVNSKTDTSTNTPNANNQFNVIINAVTAVGAAVTAFTATALESYRDSSITRRTQALDARTQLSKM